MGLKGLSERLEGGSLKYKLNTIKHELIWAWQRAWREYDDVDVFDLDQCFVSTYIEILKDFKKNSTSYPHNMTYKEWMSIIQEMTDCLEKIHWTNEIDDKYKMYYKDRFFELFSKYFFNLWD